MWNVCVRKNRDTVYKKTKIENNKNKHNVSHANCVDCLDFCNNKQNCKEKYAQINM